MEYGFTVWVIASSLVTICAAVAALTPTPKDDAFFATVRKWIDLFGFNFGFAKNEGDKP